MLAENTRLIYTDLIGRTTSFKLTAVSLITSADLYSIKSVYTEVIPENAFKPFLSHQTLQFYLK